MGRIWNGHTYGRDAVPLYKLQGNERNERRDPREPAIDDKDTKRDRREPAIAGRDP